MTTRDYQMCTRCIMDTTDSQIEFDENGVCNHCRRYEERKQSILLPEAERRKVLDRLVKDIQAKGRNREYDCVIGVSGGVDSTYLAYVARELGLRPLAVHMDNGWDSELAVSNIEKTLNKLDIDLYTYVLDWEEFKDLQIAFLKASVSDAEIPTDHAIWAVLYQAAAERAIPYILLGSNFATEGILPSSWTFGIRDWRYIKDVHQKHGRRRLKTYPHFGFFHERFYHAIRGIRVIRILNYIPYNKQEAIRVLEENLAWKPYGGKHHESIYTRFFQGYILPRKFNIDKRKAHLSTLIMSGQIAREEALEDMERPPYATRTIEDDIEYVLKKFELTQEEFEEIMALPISTYRDYQTSLQFSNILGRLQVGRLARKLGLLPS